MGDWGRALSYAEKGLERHEGNPVLLGTRLRCLNEMGRPGEALQLADELLKQDVGNPAYWLRSFVRW